MNQYLGVGFLRLLQSVCDEELRQALIGPDGVSGARRRLLLLNIWAASLPSTGVQFNRVPAPPGLIWCLFPAAIHPPSALTEAHVHLVSLMSPCVQVCPEESHHFTQQQHHRSHHPMRHRCHLIGSPRRQLQRHEVCAGPHPHWHRQRCESTEPNTKIGWSEGFSGQQRLRWLCVNCVSVCSTRRTLRWGSVWLVRPWSSTASSLSASWCTRVVSVCRHTRCPMSLRCCGRSCCSTGP